MGRSDRSGGAGNGSTRPSGVFPRPPIPAAPVRPATVGLALPEGIDLPLLARATAERITSLGQMLPSSDRVLNAIVLHGEAPLDLLTVLLRRAAVRSAWSSESDQTSPGIFVVGAVQPSLAKLVALAHAFVHPPDDDAHAALQFMARRASAAALLHAECDLESQVSWGRGALGTWVGDCYPELHPRQREVLALTVLGLERQQIADALALSIHTCDHHLRVVRTATGHGADDLVATLRASLGSTQTRHISIRAPLGERPDAVDGSTPSLGVPMPAPASSDGSGG